jgi:hypothetical protein
MVRIHTAFYIIGFLEAKANSKKELARTQMRSRSTQLLGAMQFFFWIASGASP